MKSYEVKLSVWHKTVIVTGRDIQMSRNCRIFLKQIGLILSYYINIANSNKILICFWFTGLRITPFIYYVEVVALLIEQEKSYDTMPNFTAADCKFNLTLTLTCWSLVSFKSLYKYTAILYYLLVVSVGFTSLVDEKQC